MTYAKHVRIENPIAVTENCRYCLMCRHVAPVGHVMADEAVTPKPNTPNLSLIHISEPTRPY